MPDPALLALWSDVRRDFDSARSLLPSAPIESEGSVARLNEWLEHNELELALDELEMLGTDNTPPPTYWQALLSAASRMGLAEHQARLTIRCSCRAGN